MTIARHTHKALTTIASKASQKALTTINGQLAVINVKTPREAQIPTQEAKRKYPRKKQSAITHARSKAQIPKQEEPHNSCEVSTYLKSITISESCIVTTANLQNPPHTTKPQPKVASHDGTPSQTSPTSPPQPPSSHARYTLSSKGFSTFTLHSSPTPNPSPQELQ